MSSGLRTFALHRLFHEECARVFAPEPVRFRCTCSRDRIETVLRNLGYAEVQTIIAEQGRLSVDRESCNQDYQFAPVDVQKLFAAADHQPVAPPTYIKVGIPSPPGRGRGEGMP